MAPSRRRGAIRAAKAAAARRQWKTGDLVLAKVKGFPAWPATVSEPEKWGYPPELKKVLVYFFGTQQIAFCNPSDVEAFTEQKKESLLGKRHGKGADFVRAVREIIDCYEKLKKESTENELNYETPTETLAAGDTSGRNYSTESGLAGAVEEISCDEQIPSTQPSVKAEVTPATKTYSSRRKLNSLRPRTCATLIKVPSTSRDGTLRRSNRTRRVLDDSDRHEVASPTFVSNGSIEENDSEIVTADSDTSSFNEGSSVESGGKLEPMSIEHFEEEVEFNQKPDFHGNAVILKKKRKPNRKRLRNDSAEVTAASVKEIVSQTNVISSNSLPSDAEKETERVVNDKKEDGDEHLPLFKRARVRMGRPSPVLVETDISVQMEDKRADICNSTAEHCTGPLHEGDSSFAQITSPLNKCIVKKVQFCDEKFGSSLAGESALPPSKRLHRALLAMSDYTSEDNERNVGGQSKINRSIGECCSANYCYESSDNHKLDNKSGMNRVEELLTCASMEDTTQLSTDAAVPTESFEIKSPKVGEIQPKVESPNVGAEVQVFVNHSNDSTPPIVAFNDSHEVDASDLSKPSVEPSCEMGEPACEVHQMCSDSVEGIKLVTSSPKMDAIVHAHTLEAKCDETNNLCQLSLGESKQDDEISKAEEGCALTLKESCTLSPPEKIVSFSQQELHLSCSSSVSDDHLGEKPVSITLSSSSLTDGMDSNARTSPPNTSTCNMSKSDDFVLDKPKFTDKMSNKREASAALAYFESILGTLTRTKESIGRATRVAMDCAKFGVATKVVEILSSNLECESSSHRRVDLFFLVDSIVQCSRGLKGDIGAIYPLAIQTVLPRMLSAAAPPGSCSLENQRQCLKVLKVWQERKILPESVILPRIAELETYSTFSSSGAFSRRSLRTERSFDDPIREMEGMMVDEYGSNSSIQLPGFCMPPILKDEDAVDSDGEGFEAVTPEHTVANSEGQETVVPSIEKHRRILEDVDGELEMEDVAPSHEAEIPGMDTGLASDNTYVNNFGPATLPVSPPPPPPSLPPPPLSLPPPPPPPPPPSLPPPPPPSLPAPPPPSLPPPPPSLPPPIPPPPPSSYLPPAVSVSISEGMDSKLSSSSEAVKDDLKESILQHSMNRRAEPRIPHHSPDRRGIHSESSHHAPVWGANDMPPPEGSFKKNFRLRPPHPAPSNQFSYVQSEAQASRHSPHPPYPSRYHAHNPDNDYLYRDCNDIPHRDVEDYWRTSAYPSGPCYQDSRRAPYESCPYPRQRSYRDNRWPHPSRPVNYREYFPHRTPSDGPLPVTNRGSRNWRPR